MKCKLTLVEPQIDLLFARLAMDKIPPGLLLNTDVEILKNLAPECVRSVNGREHAMQPPFKSLGECASATRLCAV